jgi:hypothetical protein
MIPMRPDHNPSDGGVRFGFRFTGRLDRVRSGLRFTRRLRAVGARVVAVEIGYTSRVLLWHPLAYTSIQNR